MSTPQNTTPPSGETPPYEADISWPPRLGNFVPENTDKAYKIIVSNGSTVHLLHTPQETWAIICYDPAGKKRAIGLSDEAAQAIAKTITQHHSTLPADHRPEKPNDQLEGLQAKLSDPAVIHAMALRHCNEGQLAHLGGEKRTEQTNELVILRARCAELEKDRARLDWLDSHMSQAANSERYLQRRLSWNNGGKFKEIRSAIDAAMSGNKEAAT